MARKQKKNTGGEQLDLIDVGPGRSAELIAVGKRYKKFQADRLTATRKEHEAKDEMRTLIAKEGMKRLDDGTIHFTLDGGAYEVLMTPQEDKLQFKELKK